MTRGKTNKDIAIQRCEHYSQMTSIYVKDIIQQLYKARNALYVIALDRDIRKWLEDNQPKTLDQVLDALGENESLKPTD